MTYEELKTILDDLVIEGSQEERKSYARKVVRCKFEKDDRVKELFDLDSRYIARWLDRGFLGFGYVDMYLRDKEDHYEYGATIYTD